MIDQTMIPDEVVEATARHDYEVRAAAVLRDFGKSLPDWDNAGEAVQMVCLTHARAALSAGLAAWPGMHVHETRRSWLGGFSERELMLPLTEARDG